MSTSASAEYSGLSLDNDGSYHAISLDDNVWSNASCTASGFRDFYIDASAYNEGHDNLFIEAVFAPGSEHNKVVAIETLSLHMYYNEIPSDRETENKQIASPDGIYSLAVSFRLVFRWTLHRR